MPDITRIPLPKIVLYLCAIFGSWAIGYAFYRYGPAAGAALGVLPVALCMVYYTVNKPAWGMLLLFVVNYYIMGISRYVDIPTGVVLDAVLAYNILLLLVHAMYRRIEWRNAATSLTLAAAVWAVYGTFQIVNPETVSVSGWFSSVRSVSYHFLVIVVLAQLLLRDLKWLKYILFIWSALTITAVIKCLIQKHFGFDSAELYWLFVSGGATTHLIGSGVRYFSFFSDAANYGASMGLSMVVFSISALYFTKWRTKIYLLAVAALACYGMLLSGTRSALAVPFAGYALFILLSKNIRIIVAGALLVVGMFCILNFTYIGQGNPIIRRARSAFDPNDPSLLVRLENQAKLRQLMRDKPFGAGLGHGGGKAKTFAPDAPISQIPTDSWFVMIWVETGVVGILMHVAILCFILARGSFLVMFRLRDPQLRGLMGALTAGIAGIVVMSYANEVFGQIPTGIIMYLSMAFIFMAPEFDRRITEGRLLNSETHE